MFLSCEIVRYSVFTYLCRYKQEFGFTIPGRPIIVDDIRVRGKGKACNHNQIRLTLCNDPPQLLDVSTNCSTCVCMCKYMCVFVQLD